MLAAGKAVLLLGEQQKYAILQTITAMAILIKMIMALLWLVPHPAAMVHALEAERQKDAWVMADGVDMKTVLQKIMIAACALSAAVLETAMFMMIHRMESALMCLAAALQTAVMLMGMAVK